MHLLSTISALGQEKAKCYINKSGFFAVIYLKKKGNIRSFLIVFLYANSLCYQEFLGYITIFFLVLNILIEFEK